MMEYYAYYSTDGIHPFKVFGATKEERDRGAAHFNAEPFDLESYYARQKEFNNPPPFFTQERRDNIMMVILWGSIIVWAICQLALI